MKKTAFAITLIWISTSILTGCTSSKEKIFGRHMPTMKTIHDQKFKREKTPLNKPVRPLNKGNETPPDMEFQWLPNPTLAMYVFKHLSPAGHPIPGYSTFFKMYTRDHIAEPDERAGWE